MYRRILKPIHADYIAFIRERTLAKVFFHTDGDVFPLIDDLSEIGVDILNPIQTSAGKMSDLDELKAAMGRPADVLRRRSTPTASCRTGTPDEVRAEVRRVIDDPGPRRRLHGQLRPHRDGRCAGREHPRHGRCGR